MFKWKKAISVTAAAVIAATSLATMLPVFASDSAPDVTGYEKLLLASSLNNDFESSVVALSLPNASAQTVAGKLREGHKSLVLSPGTATGADQINTITEQNYLREGVGCTANWKGAEYLEFWAKNETATDVSFIVTVYEGSYSPNIAPVCPWQPSGDYYLEGASGTSKATASGGSISVPGNFEGIIRMPLSGFTNPGWHVHGDTCGIADKIDLPGVRVDLQNIAKLFPTTISIDDIAVIGKDLDEIVDIDIAKQKRMEIHAFEAYESDGFMFDGFFKTPGEKYKLGYDETNKSKGDYSFVLEKVTGEPNQYGGIGFSTFAKPGDVTSGSTHDWTGGEAIGLWVKNDSGYKEFGIQFYESNGQTEGRGPKEPWVTSGAANTSRMFLNCYYLQDKDGNVTKITQKKLAIPANFEGYIYVPLNQQNFEMPTWLTPDSPLHGDGIMQINDIAQVSIVFQPIDGAQFAGNKLYMDEIFVSGTALKALEVKDSNKLGGESDQVIVPKASVPEGLLLSDVLVIKEKITQAETLDAIKAAAKSNKLEYLYAFDFIVTGAKDLTPITFADKVTGTTKLPEDFDINGNKVYLYSNNTFKALTYTVSDGILSFESDAFGTIVIAKEIPSDPSSKPEDSSKPGNTDKPVETGVASGIGFLMLTVISGGAVLVSKKNRK